MQEFDRASGPGQPSLPFTAMACPLAVSISDSDCGRPITFASCANDKHSQSLKIPVRIPGYEVSETQDKTLQAGHSAAFSFKKLGWNNFESVIIYFLRNLGI